MNCFLQRLCKDISEHLAESGKNAVEIRAVRSADLQIR